MPDEVEINLGIAKEEGCSVDFFTHSVAYLNNDYYCDEGICAYVDGDGSG